MAGLNKVTVDDIDVKGKKVLVRVDFNVPMKDGVITNDNRIQAALPTIKKLVSEGGKVILCSHLGKPKNGPEAKFSLKAAAERLAELVAPTKVTFVPSDKVVDDSVKAAVDAMQDGEIIVLENTRFRGAEETKNGEEFSKELASLADVFVMDAFGSAHSHIRDILKINRNIPKIIKCKTTNSSRVNNFFASLSISCDKKSHK